MSNRDVLDDSLANAAKSLQNSSATATTPTSQGTNIWGVVSTIKDDVDDPTVQALAPVATQSVELVQSQVDKIVSASKILTSALDDLAKIHPFVSVAVLAFKTALQFEVARRENDRRVLLAHAKMNDMLSVLLIIRPIVRGERASDGKTIKQRLSARIEAIATDIEKYAALCDTFSKKRKLVKLLRSLEWEGKLESYIKAFDDHKQTLQDDLSIYSSHGIHQVNETLAKISAHIGGTVETTNNFLLIQALRSPVDRELLAEIGKLGGADRILKDEGLMRTLMEKAGDKDPQTAPLKDILRDVNRSFTDMMQENEELFNRKFKAQQEVLMQGMSTVARREGDRVIGAIMSGPHDRIVDPDLYNVWKQSGWKGMTDARGLVLSLREYYIERHQVHEMDEHRALEEISLGVSATNSLHSTVTLQSSTTIPSPSEDLEDEWALAYISVSRVQPLLEALDDDGSMLVSISEVNAFSDARPRRWSLLKWMAYWAAGFSLTQGYYLRRTQILLQRITTAAQEAHKSFPANSLLVDFLVNNFSLTKFTDALLASVSDGLDHSTLVWDHDLFTRFKGYVDDEETKLRKELRLLEYCIDEKETLEVIMGSSRLDQILLPLVYLLLRRTWNVLRHARRVALDPRELGNIVQSFREIMHATEERIDHLVAMYTLQNLDPKEQLQKFCYGIYYYHRYGDDSEVRKSSKYFQSTEYLTPLPLNGMDTYDADWNSRFHIPYSDIVDVKEHNPPEPLLYPSPDITPKVEVYDEGSISCPLVSDDPSDVWSCRISHKETDGSYGPGLPYGVLHIALPTSCENGLLVLGGSGNDGSDFIVTGQIQGSMVVLDKRPTSSQLRRAIERFSGTINETRDTIEGVYSWVWGEDVEPPALILPEDSQIRGRMEYHLSRPRFSHLVPNEGALATNKPAAMWRFAIESALTAVRLRAGRLNWPHLSERRRIRRRLIELYIRTDSTFPELPRPSLSKAPQGRILSDKEEEFMSLLPLCSRQDWLVYKDLALIVRRSQRVHWAISCKSSPTTDHPIPSVRYHCLDCLPVDLETDAVLARSIDLCPDCNYIPVAMTSRGSTPEYHMPSHAIVQLRTPVSAREEWRIILNAKDHLKMMRDYEGLSDNACCYCEKIFEGPPYWRCISCYGSAHYMCDECKTENEDRQARDQEYQLPSISELFARRGNQDNNKQDTATHEEDTAAQIVEDETSGLEMTHSLKHDLVFYQPPPRNMSERSENTVQDMLLTLQDRVDSFDSRLKSLETLIRQFIATSSGSNKLMAEDDVSQQR